MAFLLGWKDILRPIRDGYRHLFPSPDTGPTLEERQRQRAIDRLKGFTYFDTFEQLESWTHADTDPLQRANTPLLIRSVGQNEEAKANVLLCHDYAGNYHAYEGTSNLGMNHERYACEYLQYVDTFIYFSHKLVCVPPPTWTNTLHRNGVKALGTILIEPQTLSSEKLLRRDDDGVSFPLATILADISGHYGFDGWLVNIEKPFAAATWDPQVLATFLRQLKFGLGIGKQLIWYDALTTSNTVAYQNALNVQNSIFAKACGSMLTNYCWNEHDAADSVHNALENTIPPQRIYFGVDVWAQNTMKLTQPRVTYPEFGGGGTNTGVAVAKVAELGLSAGIFAPAWTFEHFPCYGIDVERTVWEGVDLPENITCSCGSTDKRHQPNKTMSVTKSAKSYSAGSEFFFFTDFSRAFSMHGDQETEKLYGGHPIHAQLSSQSILPLGMESTDTSNPLRYRIEDSTGHSRLVIECLELPSSSVDRAPWPTESDGWRIPLFKFDMPADGSLRLRIHCRNITMAQLGTCFYMKISGMIHRLEQSEHSRNENLLDVLVSVRGPVPRENPRLEELGFFLRATHIGAKTRLVEIDDICIKPEASYPNPSQSVPCRAIMPRKTPSQHFPFNTSSQTHAILNIRARSQGEGEMQHTRLCWDHISQNEPSTGMPFSAITEAFSYFVIYVDGLVVGRAYVLEHVLPAPFVEQLTGREVFVQIRGIGFDGQELAGAQTTLHF